MSVLRNKFQQVLPPPDISIVPGCVERLAAGDPEACRWMYENYAGIVYHYAFLMTSDPMASEDIVHDVFLRIWENRKKLPAISNWNGYLYIIYRNSVMDHFRAKEREKKARTGYGRSQIAALPVTEQMLDEKEAGNRIKWRIRQMPPHRQLVFRLSKENGMKAKDIARKLGIAPGTVKEHLRQGSEAIRQAIDYINPG